MEEKNVNTILEILAEKVRELQLDLNLMRYERDELRKENAKLKEDVKFYEDSLKTEDMCND